jgi:hypothetical protein
MRRNLRRFALFISVQSICLFANLAHSEEKPAWTANPAYIYQQKGSYPSSVTVRLFWNNCQYDNNGQIEPNQLKTGPYAVSITGVLVNATTPVIGDCSLTTTLDMSNAQPGLQTINVTDKDKKDHGFASIGFMDATAGPTPDKPEVDVLWEVLTDHLCKDNFGNHMPSDLYCIDVKIGNNSGHALQLAGLGFMRKSLLCKTPNGTTTPCNGEKGDIATPNVGYQTVRASSQNSSFYTGRNLFVNGMQAVGLLMASFTPYFENPFNKSRWSTGAAIVSAAIPQASNLVSPDLTIRELNNLDDQAFREGKTIPNNTQVRLLVFVQKKSVAEAISEVIPQIKSASTISGCNDVPLGYKKEKGTCYPAWEDSFKNCLKKLDCNPVVVKLALGHLVVVGSTIDYIQRIVVDSNVTSQETRTPITPQSAVLSANAEVETITGAGMQDATKLVLTCKDTANATKPAAQTDVTSGIKTKTSTQITFSVAADTLQKGNNCDISVTGKNGDTETLQNIKVQ